MTDSVKLIPVLLNKGLAAVFNKDADGLTAKVTHVGFGDYGRDNVDKNSTGLVNELIRIPITAGERIADHQIHITAALMAELSFWVKEIAFYLEDGTCLAIWSSTTPLTYLSPALPLLIGLDLILAELPANSIEVIGTDPDLSLIAYVDKYISNVASNICTKHGVIKNCYQQMLISEKIKRLGEIK